MSRNKYRSRRPIAIEISLSTSASEEQREVLIAKLISSECVRERLDDFRQGTRIRIKTHDVRALDSERESSLNGAATYTKNRNCQSQALRR